MKQEEWNEGLNHLDPDLTAQYVEQKDRYSQKKQQTRRRWLRGGAVAACLALLVGRAILLSNTRKSPPAEVVVLRAEELAAVFGSHAIDSPVTNVYTTVYSPSEEYLQLNPATYSQYIPLYYATKPPEIKARLQEFIDEHLETAGDFFGIQSRDYQITFGYRGYYGAQVADARSRLSFSVENNLLNTYFYSLDDDRLTVNGNTVSLLASDTDEEMEYKLRDTAAYLCDVFGKDYTAAKIHRKYSDSGLSSITVYLYTPEDTGFPSQFPQTPIASEYMVLTFHTDTGRGTIYNWGEPKDKAFLIDVQLYETVRPWNEYYQVSGVAEMLTLEEAEELLEKGYVFSNHVCKLCMENQMGVDFSDYTYVALEYVFDEDAYLNFNRVKRPCIPFYTFYKYLGQTDQGMGSYAKTYVPAIKVPDLEEYFEKQTALHQ